MAEKNIAVLEQPPYSLDLAPCEFCLSPKLKGIIKWTRFEGMVTIKRVVTSRLGNMQEVWQRRIENYIRLEGGYVDGKTMLFAFWNLNQLYLTYDPLLYTQISYTAIICLIIMQLIDVF